MADEVMSQNVSGFKWTSGREKCALACALHRTEQQAADDAGVSRKTISRLNQQPEFLARVRDYLKPARERALIELERAAPEAAKKIVELTVYGIPGHSVQLAAAKDILDRTGLKATEKHEHVITPGTVSQLTDDALEAELKKRGLE